MFASTFKVQRQAIALAVPIILVILLFLLSFTHLFATHNCNFSVAITFDLIFSIPLIHFILSDRNKRLKYSTALFFTAGLIIASLIIPEANQSLLHEIKLWVVPVIEFCGIIFFVRQTKKIRANYANSQNYRGDFYTIFKHVSAELLPGRLASIITAEISAFYYGFFHWEKVNYNDKSFSYHKRSGTVTLIGVFIFMILLETSVFHLALSKWSGKAAWLLSGLSLYAAMQAFGIARSICKRPILITDHYLVIPYGILAETSIALSDISDVRIHSKTTAISENTRFLSPFKKLEKPDIGLKLNKIYYVEGIYGSRKAFDQLIISVDDKENFLRQIKIACN